MFRRPSTIRAVFRGLMRPALAAGIAGAIVASSAFPHHRPPLATAPDALVIVDDRAAIPEPEARSWGIAVGAHPGAAAAIPVVALDDLAGRSPEALASTVVFTPTRGIGAAQTVAAERDAATRGERWVTLSPAVLGLLFVPLALAFARSRWTLRALATLATLGMGATLPLAGVLVSPGAILGPLVGWMLADLTWFLAALVRADRRLAPLGTPAPAPDRQRAGPALGAPTPVPASPR